MTHYHQYLGNYPKERENGWSKDIQGVTHDDHNWFFTQTNKLWKFPVGHDLNKKVTAPDPASGILRVEIPNELKNAGYDHLGDFDYYQGHLFIPVEGKKDGKRLQARIAIFSANGLSYMGSFLLTKLSKDNKRTPQFTAPWCAVKPDTGLLYTSEGLVSASFPLLVYKIDHTALLSGVVNPGEFSSWHNILRGTPLELKCMQGGAFNAEGTLLYLIHGYFENCNEEECGIKVFDIKHARLVDSSSNGNEPFNYEFHQSSWQEAEGITVWDLTDGRAPGITGKVHALMLENDYFSPDDLFFKHYTSSLN
jgi:hypothetical protein